MPTSPSSNSPHANQVIAHRGYQKYFPENSPLAIRQAIAHGAQYIEIDVQFTADDIPVLCHDDDLSRIAGINKKLNQLNFSDLKDIIANEPKRLGNQFSDTRIVSLQQLVDILQEHPSVQALVEIKEEAVRDYGASFCLQRIYDTLLPVLDRCILISFDIDALHVAKTQGFKRLGAVLRHWPARFTTAEALQAEMVICNFQRIPEIDSLYMENCHVAIYEVDDIEHAQSLLARGARFIESFSIGEMLGTHDKQSPFTSVF